MRACINQYVKNGEIYCTGNNEPCDDLRPMTEKNLLLCCPDICEPEDGSTWSL